MTLELYTRVGCDLCEQMLEAVLPLIRGRAKLTLVDIDQDADLRQRFDTRLPVLCAGEDELMAGQFDRGALIQWLVSQQV
ncbi:MAG: glutaredoxin family protein [Pseudomonadota bacterium]